MDSNFWIAIFNLLLFMATIALVIVTYRTGQKQIKASNEALEKQLQSSRESLGVDLVLRLDDRFNNKDHKEMRQTVAININNYPDFQPVLDFLEIIGTLTRKKVLDRELVWAMFFHWVHHYRHLANDYIEHYRIDNKTIWEDFLWLHEEILKIEMEKRPGMNPIPEKEDREDFVEEELYLLPRRGE